MKGQSYENNEEKEKAAAIGTLFSASIIIMLIGTWISLYSLINGINFPVLNTQVPGVLFGVPVVYLGFRYFMAVRDLRAKISETASNFSWTNCREKRSDVL